MNEPSNKPTLGRLDPLAVRLVSVLRQIAVASIATAPWLARPYYALISNRFSREQRAVIAGIRRHQYPARARQLQYRMRRGIHRLEKGLSMRERRPVFGLDYIAQVVRDYCLIRSSGLDAAETLADEMYWYEAVLDRYFTGCNTDKPHFVRAKAEYVAARRMPPAQLHRSPYLASERPAPAVTSAQFEQLAIRRRSVRWFNQQPVERSTLETAAVTAAQSPSACNRQSVRIELYDKPEDARRIGRLPPGAAGLYQNFPALAVLIGDLSAYAYERDRHAIYVDGGLKAMTFMYALESMGLSTCALNWPDNGHLDNRAAKELGLEMHERVVLMIAIGHADPDGLVPYSHKESGRTA
jgi:nitroreductase